MVKRITGENSSECTAHAGAVFYKFLEFAAALQVQRHSGV
jgi:hypothetical protein